MPSRSLAPFGAVLSSVLLLLVGDPLTAAAGPPAELPAFTPQREQSALAFVAEHHPELSKVLAGLKQADREQYEQAVRELFQTSDRLAMLKGSDEILYGLMLDGWKTQSRAQVLAARIACAAERDPALEAELRGLIAKKVDLELQTIAHNRDRTLKVVEGLENSLKQLEANREEIIERRINALTRGNKKAGTKPQTTPAPRKVDEPKRGAAN
jgi:hypothetical protein